MTTLDTTPDAPAPLAVDLLLMARATQEKLHPVPLPPEVVAAWSRIRATNGAVRTPEADRPWTTQDVATADTALEAARTLREHAAAIEAAVTQGYLTQLDLSAAARAATDPQFAKALATLPRDRNGHLALGSKGHPMQVPVPGTDFVLSAEYRMGAPTMTLADLQELRRAKKISRGEYRRLTTVQTVIDTGEMTRAIGENPGLADRLRGAWRSTGTCSISVHHRRAKTS